MFIYSQMIEHKRHSFKIRDKISFQMNELNSRHTNLVWHCHNDIYCLNFENGGLLPLEWISHPKMLY